MWERAWATYAEKAYLDKSGNFAVQGGLTVSGFPNSRITSTGSAVDLGNSLIPVRATYFIGSSPVTGFYASTGGGFSAPNTTRIWSETLGAGASDVLVKAGAYIADSAVDPAAKLFSVRTGLGGSDVEKLAVNGAGRVDQSGSDSSATPGAATIKKPTGVSAIAAGANTVVITNSLATATSRISVTWHGDHGAPRWWVTRSAGSFTVTLSAAASANTAFSWEVASLL